MEWGIKKIEARISQAGMAKCQPGILSEENIEQYYQ
jgi:hypothetical protein